jgi:hypothetical protein
VGRLTHRRRCRLRLVPKKSLGQLTGVDDAGDAQRTPEGAPPLR